MKVIIPHEVHNKIMYWVKNTDIEVSGLGKVVLDKEKQTFTVTSAMLLPQVGTGTTTKIEAKDVAKAMFETKDQAGVLAFWWHSHVKMDAFWSGTDVNTIEDTAQGGLCVATVFNHYGKTKTSVAFKAEGPFGPTVVRYDDVTMEVASPEPSAEELSWKAELDAKLATPKPYLLGLPRVDGFLFNDDGSYTGASDRRPNLWRNQHAKDDWEAGITGMGIDTEARTLGVSKKALKKVIQRGENDPTFKQFEMRLYQSW